MEAAGLYTKAAELGREALAILTVSDHIFTGEASTAEERQSTYDEMINLALATITG
jgi:purine-nucleoside phosphorylase